jgi:hypothetical protein
MTIIVEVKPEVQLALSRQAAARGVDVSAYAADLLEEALSRDQLDRTLQDLAQFSYKIPALPNETFSRESLYRDHD